MPWREQRQSPDGELPDVTVYDDDAVDVLQGALGTDWFFANRSGGVALDILNGLRLPGREAGVVPGPARAVIARAAAADLDLPVVNCPTVASSDAPCSPLSVLYTEEGVFHEYRFYRKNPDLVLVDTQVIARGPPRLLVAGMGDALARWFEAKTCVAGHVKNMRGGERQPAGSSRGRNCQRLLPQALRGKPQVARRTEQPGASRPMAQGPSGRDESPREYPTESIERQKRPPSEAPQEAR